MKAEFVIDIQQLVQEITQEVTNAIRPMLEKGATGGDSLFTVETLAIYLGVKKQWVYDRVAGREIPFIKMGKFPRFRKADIDRWLDTLRTPTMNPCSKGLKRMK